MMMKYSITLASFRKIEPIEETLARLAKQGFDAVEMYGEPEEVDLKKLKDALSTARLPVCGITGMWGRASTQGWKRKLLSTDHSLVTASEKYVKDCIRMCSQLGGKEMNICLFANEIAEFLTKRMEQLRLNRKSKFFQGHRPCYESYAKKQETAALAWFWNPSIDIARRTAPLRLMHFC